MTNTNPTQMPMEITAGKGMSKSERDDLCRLVRANAKIMKAATEQRGAELRADFESQMARLYSWSDDEVWSKAAAEVESAVAVARKTIDEQCGVLGIPEEFRPTIRHYSTARGQNATAERRTELRFVATTRIKAIEKAAHTEIERVSVDLQTKLIASGLTSDAAKQFLEDMPKLDVLMPILNAGEIKRLAGHKAAEEDDERRHRHRQIYGD